MSDEQGDKSDTITRERERANVLKSFLDEIALLVYARPEGSGHTYTLADLVQRVRMLVREAAR